MFEAIQTQWGWAYGLDVVLLASGYNKPQVGSSGSGIYQGRSGALAYYMADMEGSKLIVSPVPKKLSSGEKSFYLLLVLLFFQPSNRLSAYATWSFYLFFSLKSNFFYLDWI